MAEVFEFDPAALRALASDMGTVAEDIRAVTGTNEPLQGVARALPGSLTGAACTAAAPHVYATAALGDPVPLYAGTGDFGPNPDGPFFGSTTFNSNANVPWDAHSSYWDPGSDGLINMGLIISGNGDRVS